MGVQKISVGSTTEQVQQTLRDILNFGLGAGQGNGINWATATNRFNALADTLGLDGLADKQPGAVALSNINAVVDGLGVPDKASLYYDWENNRYFGGVPALSRASKAWDFNAADVLYEADNHVLRRVSGRGALLESQRTNVLAGSMMTGAVVGVVGSGGSLPTAWNTPPSGWTVEVLAVGIDPADGLPFIRMRVQATQAASTWFLNYGWGNCVQGERYIASFWARVVGGTTAGLSEISLTLSNRNSGGSGLPGSAGLTIFGDPTSTARRVARFTATAADTGRMLIYSAFSKNGASAVDVTVEIKQPQGEKVPVGVDEPSSPILTGGSAVTRSGEILAAPAAGGGRAFAFKFENLGALVQPGWRHLLDWSNGTSANRHTIYITPGGTMNVSSRASGVETSLGGSTPVPFGSTGVIYGVFDSAYRRVSRVGAVEGAVSAAENIPAGIDMLGIGGTGYNIDNNANMRARLFAEAPVSAFTDPADAYAWAKSVAEGMAA